MTDKQKRVIRIAHMFSGPTIKDEMVKAHLVRMLDKLTVLDLFCFEGIMSENTFCKRNIEREIHDM
jgi:hypothetical protein